ncbi:MAG: hypothetical protein AAF514_09515 [Verrucomicrobiota bacterium]
MGLSGFSSVIRTDEKVTFLDRVVNCPESARTRFPSQMARESHAFFPKWRVDRVRPENQAPTKLPT